ncbi:MAG: type II secretion system protein [Smithella sp.]|jgi:MSHA pilin protein MshC
MNKTAGQFKDQGGFTMIEIISVLVLIGILTLVAIVKLTSTNYYNLAAETEVVKAHLRYAQSRAINSRNVSGINFSSGSYTFFINGNTANVRMLPDQNGAGNVTLPGGMSITTGIVAFDSWGKPFTDAAGTQAQSGSRTLTLSQGSNTSVITITPNTGFVP